MTDDRTDALARIDHVCSLIVIVMGKIDRDMDELITLRNELNAILTGLKASTQEQQ